MIRVYKDAPTKVDLLKAVVLIEKSVELASPLVQEQFRTKHSFSGANDNVFITRN